MADTNEPSINLIDLVKAHAYCYGEELRRCQCGQVTLNDVEWQAHFAHVLSLYVDVPAAPQSDHPAQGHIHSDVCYGRFPKLKGPESIFAAVKRPEMAQAFGKNYPRCRGSMGSTPEI